MANTFGKVSGTYQEADQVYAKVSGTWEEMDEVYAKDSGTWRLVFSAFEATSFATLSSGSGSFVVPDQANAIHIQFAVGAGGGGFRGASYDKAGGESAGAGGGSSGYNPGGVALANTGSGGGGSGAISHGGTAGNRPGGGGGSGIVLIAYPE